jgi:hypothetical protein
VDTELTGTGARLYIKLGIGELYKNLGSHFIVVLDQTILKTTCHAGLHALPFHKETCKLVF